MDLALEAFVAAVLIAAGSVLRLGRRLRRGRSAAGRAPAT
jgi:hypothetical protein